MTAPARRKPVSIRPEWLATHDEDVLDPGRRIVDAHHHLYRRPDLNYLLEDMLADIADSEHDIRASVYVQARAMLRADGPDAMKPVGETEFANGIAAMSASGAYGSARVCAGIVGFADLLLGNAVEAVLEAHKAAGGAHGTDPGRFRGIRQIAVWDADPGFANPVYPTTEDMLDSDAFRAGFARLAPLDLSFDAWLLFHQLPRLIRLARDFPETRIVLNHCGGIAGIGPYEGKRDEVFSMWSKAVADLAGCDNVMVKLGGLGMPLSGFGFEAQPAAPDSRALAAAWKPYMTTLIEAFGSHRCMFESNFPVDKGSHSYRVGWNAMKHIASAASETERDDLFWRSATRFYRLSVPGLDVQEDYHL